MEWLRPSRGDQILAEKDENEKRIPGLTSGQGGRVVLRGQTIARESGGKCRQRKESGTGGAKFFTRDQAKCKKKRKVLSRGGPKNRILPIPKKQTDREGEGRQKTTSKLFRGCKLAVRVEGARKKSADSINWMWNVGKTFSRPNMPGPESFNVPGSEGTQRGRTPWFNGRDMKWKKEGQLCTHLWKKNSRIPHSFVR